MRVSSIIASLWISHLCEAAVSNDFVRSLVETNKKAHVVIESPLAKDSPVHFQFMRDVVHHSSSSSSSNRRLAGPRSEIDKKQQTCDQSFLECLPYSKCIDCFLSLQTERIDWTSVAPETPCPDVVKFLLDKNYCTELRDDNTARDKFCTTFNACVVWDDTNSNVKKENSTALDCSTLTKCEWPGMHRRWVGDGICHDNVYGCYNSEVCGWDGGDCCKDSCLEESELKKCGTDGWACRNPKSVDCNPSYTSKCDTPFIPEDSDYQDMDSITCASDETKYRLIMYDSFGDGWDKTTLEIRDRKDIGTTLFSGGLKYGARGERPICLSKSSSCYEATVKGGVWGNEVSWEIKPLAEGAKSIADGGAPMDCTFAVSGDSCKRTCSAQNKEGRPSHDATGTSYDDVAKCVQDKCIIQIGACLMDTSCSPCLTQIPPDYCFANDNFNAVVTCSLCNCMDNESQREKDTFCQGGSDSNKEPANQDENAADAVTPCTSAQTFRGSTAVAEFSQCTDIDQVGMMVVDFDNDHFGALDSFELCAHSYHKDRDHGGRTAQSCMKILKNAVDAPLDDGHKDDTKVPIEAVSALAKHLFEDAESLCSCASEANVECPQCPSFEKFKTLLNEALDACVSLDEIDCAAWDEFQSGCKSRMSTKFGRADFSQKEQCDFVRNGCEDAGPFPAFRRLDCKLELPKSSWDFYTLYQRECLEGEAPYPSTPRPTRAPIQRPSSNEEEEEGDDDEEEEEAPFGFEPTPPPTPKPYIPDNGPIPYTPSDDDIDPESSSSSLTERKGYNPDGSKKKSHFWRNIMIMGLLVGGVVGYTEYRKRGDNFSFVRYRQTPAPRDYGNEMGVYSGVPQQNAATSFQPPTLPPSDLDHL